MFIYVRRLLPVALAAAMLLSGCSGSRQSAGSSVLPDATTTGAKASAHRRTTTTLRIRIPKKVRLGGRLHPHFVSPSTQSATIAIAPSSGCATCSAGFTQNIGLTATSTGCTATATGTVCSCTFVLAPGTYTGSMTTYDGALDGTGKPTGATLSLDQSFPLAVVAGAANTPTISLYGVPANITCTAVSGASISIFSAAGCNGAEFIVAAGTTSTFAVYALDVDGNLMLGPGAPTFTGTGDGGFSYATKGNTIQVTPPAINSGLNTIDIMLTSPACSVAGALCEFSGFIAFDSLVAIANSGNSTVTIFSRLELLAGAGAPYAVISNGISAPQGLAFDQNGDLFVVNGTSAATSSVTEYAPPYTGAPTATLTKNLNLPYAIAIGADGRLGVLNGGSATAEVFVPPYTATPYQAPISFTDATALAFDSNENLWISFFTQSEVERFTVASNYATIDTVLNNSNAVSHRAALALDNANNLYVGNFSATTGKVLQFQSPYSGMPAHSSNPIASVSSIAVDNSKNAVAACGLGTTLLSRTADLTEYSSNFDATNGCQLAFDRLGDLDAVYAGPDSARTLTYDAEFENWFLLGRTFTSTTLSTPAAIATWP